MFRYLEDSALFGRKGIGGLSMFWDLEASALLGRKEIGGPSMFWDLEASALLGRKGIGAHAVASLLTVRIHIVTAVPCHAHCALS